MRSAILAAFLTLTVAAQTAEPVKIGPAAKDLSAADVTQIVALTKSAGLEPWVLVAANGIHVDRNVLAFGRPAGGPVRRGRAIQLHAPYKQSPAVWAVSGSFDVAQVPESGRDPNQVSSARDLNRPFFRYPPSLADADVLAVVTLLRSHPVLADVRVEIHSDWPIESVRREPLDQVDGIVVSTVDEDSAEMSGQKVLFRRVATRWTIVSAVTWSTD